MLDKVGSRAPGAKQQRSTSHIDASPWQVLQRLVRERWREYAGRYAFALLLMAIASGATLTFDGGTHVLQNGFNAAGAGTSFITNGTVQVNTAATATFENLTLGGGILRGDGTVTVADQLLWTNGDMRDGGITQVGAAGTITLAGTTMDLLDGHLLINGSTTNPAIWSGGALRGGGGS